MSPRTIIFFGRSGCGKGTQADLLIKYFSKFDKKHRVVYIETGKKFREFMHESSLTARLTRKVIEAGGLLPEFLPIWIWTDHMIRNLDGEEHLILDGLSRRPQEAPVLDSAMKFYGRKMPIVIHLDVSREWAKKRLLARARVDDNKRDIDERLAWYESNVIPTIQFFKKDSYYNFVDINGDQSVEKVHEDILRAIHKVNE